MPSVEQQPNCVSFGENYCSFRWIGQYFPVCSINSRISENLQEYIPNLTTLIMTGNNIQELGDLEPLTHLPKLETLCLLMNPVSTKPNYREYVAFK